MTRIVPPKPPSRQGGFALWQYLRTFRRDILSANPERLYGAKMAEFRMPFLHTFLVNDPALWRRVLTDRLQKSRLFCLIPPSLSRSRAAHCSGMN